MRNKNRKAEKITHVREAKTFHIEKKKKRDYKVSTKALSQIAHTNLSPINHHFYCIDAIVSVF